MSSREQTRAAGGDRRLQRGVVGEVPEVEDVAGAEDAVAVEGAAVTRCQEPTLMRVLLSASRSIDDLMRKCFVVSERRVRSPRPVVS
jgi:hypothetical protein